MSELPITDPPRWAVRTKYHTQTKAQKLRKEEPIVKHHELTYGGFSHEKGKGEGELERLRSLAIIFNRAKVAPKASAVECAADAPNAARYLQKISGLR